MIRPFLVFPFLAAFICLYLLSRKNSEGMEDVIAQYGFRITLLAPPGLYLAGRFPVSLGAAYDRSIKDRLAQLYGQKHDYPRVHLAQKYALSLALVFVLGILGLLGRGGAVFFVYALFLPLPVFYLTDRELDKKIDQRKRSILIDLPTFLNTLALLLGAGLTYTASVEKVVADAGPGRPLYRELQVTLSELQSGSPVSRAYENLSRRCGIPEITRFASTVLQNINRGSSDLAHVLSLLSQECWQKRKEIARKQGEEASSKLVFPMVMIFVAVSIIVLAPAIMAMSR
ncbi:MAG: type II secretion system F family protein [Actinobacteria bacterium]|nr:type II secretion system F family protein [Actinomycetota bacterium]